MSDDPKPLWAARMRAERLARGWSQTDAARALEVNVGRSSPATTSLLRNWKRWEAADVEPDDFYKPLIAKTFDTVTAVIFPRLGRRDANAELLEGSGMDTMELISRLRSSDVSPVTLDALRITADRLCSEYPRMSPQQLSAEGQTWLHRIRTLLDRRLTLSQHREVLSLAGTIALLTGCVEYDMGMRAQARATRRAALSLGEEAGNSGIMGWAHEMAAWFALTQGDYRSVISATGAGEAVAPHSGVAVQLAAQRAKALARMGDRREMKDALDHGRNLLEKLPSPEDTDHHFVVDPAKFDFYAMDCFRRVGESSRAVFHANEVIRSSTDPDGTQRKPMRIAEAKLTLGIVLAEEGDIEQAVFLGREAIAGERKSLPSLLMVSSELREILANRYPLEREVVAYSDELRALSSRSVA